MKDKLHKIYIDTQGYVRRTVSQLLHQHAVVSKPNATYVSEPIYNPMQASEVADRLDVECPVPWMMVLVPNTSYLCGYCNQAIAGASRPIMIRTDKGEDIPSDQFEYEERRPEVLAQEDDSAPEPVLNAKLVSEIESLLGDDNE